MSLQYLLNNNIIIGNSKGTSGNHQLQQCQKKLNNYIYFNEFA